MNARIFVTGWLWLLLPALAQATDSFLLYRGGFERADDSVDLFIRGAPANSEVLLFAYVGGYPDWSDGDWEKSLTTADPNRTPPLGPFPVDSSGMAHIHQDSSQWEAIDFVTVVAVAMHNGVAVKSNFTVLKELPALYLLVEKLHGGSGQSQVLQFDPAAGSLNAMVAGIRRHSSRSTSRRQFEISGNQPTVFYEPENDSTVIQVGASLSGEQEEIQAVPLGDERVLDMIATVDHAALLVLTVLELPSQRTRLSLRLLNCRQADWQSSLFIGFAETENLDAWLVASRDSRRVFIGQRLPGLDQILECFVSDELLRGSWIAPSSIPELKRLTDFVVSGDLLAAVSESGDGRGLLTVFDLRHEGRMLFSHELAGTALDVAVIERAGLEQILVITDGEGGTLEMLRLQADRESTPLVSQFSIPGATQLATANESKAAYILCQREHQGQFFQLDLLTRELSLLNDLPIAENAHDIGILTNLPRAWLYWFQPKSGALQDSILWVPLDRAGKPRLEAGVSELETGGSVTRVRSNP